MSRNEEFLKLMLEAEKYPPHMDEGFPKTPEEKEEAWLRGEVGDINHE